jgi:hypothetical protein
MKDHRNLTHLIIGAVEWLCSAAWRSRERSKGSHQQWLVSDADVAEGHWRFSFVDEWRVYNLRHAKLLSEATCAVATVDVPFVPHTCYHMA